MAAAFDSLTRCFDADQLNIIVADKGGESTNRVGTATDARDHSLRQPSFALENLRACFVTNAALEIADNRRIGRRPDR